MQISFFRLYKIIPFVWIFIGLLVGFWSWLKTYSGHPEMSEYVVNVFNFSKSIGLYLIAIPIISLLASPLKEKELNVFHRISFCLQAIGGLLFCYFLIAFKNGSYIGFEQAPEQGELVWMSCFLFALGGCLLGVVGGLVGRPEKSVTQKMASLFTSASVGLGFGLFILNTLFIVAPSEASFSVFLPLAKMETHLISMAAFVAVFSRMKSYSKLGSAKFTFNSGVLAVSSLLFLAGANAADFFASSEYLFILTQFMGGIGIIGLLVLVVSEMRLEIAKEGTHFITSSRWIPYISLILLLAFTLLMAFGPTSSMMSFGLLEYARTISSVIVVPAMFFYTLQDREGYSHFASLVSRTLLWCGMAVCILPLFALTSSGASISQISNPIFVSQFGIVAAGLFLVMASFLVKAWDQFLGEFI